jgi:hypothetical protein
MRLGTSLGLAVILAVLMGYDASADWRPTEALARIPVIENCAETGGDIAVSRPGPVIYYCQAAANALNQRWPDAGHFYYVHEFGHQALQSANEAQADCWAAKESAKLPDGQHYLDAAIEHFEDRGPEYHPRYGTAAERAARIRRCATEVSNSGSEGRRKEPLSRLGRSCCMSRGGMCGPFLNQPALPVGSPCSCQYGNPFAAGTVCQ